jgi:hypothetical protein
MATITKSQPTAKQSAARTRRPHVTALAAGPDSAAMRANSVCNSAVECALLGRLCNGSPAST